jgi:hypothetical protein
MSWASTISRSITTPNQSSRDGRKITGWIIHHNASTGGSYVLSLMQSGDKQVSANYQVMQDGEVVGVVARELRSWSASNSAWDGASLTFEIANNSGAPGWTISEGAYLSVARTIAEDAVWAGIPINRTTVRGHREGSALGDGGSYATACPGGIDLDRLVTMANQIRSSGTAGLGVTPIEEEDMPKAKLYRNADNSDLRIMNPETGLEFGVPSNAYVDLVIGWKVFDGVTSNVPINLPGNVFEFVRSLGASVRASSPVDAGAIAASVGGQVTAAVKAALADIQFDGDVEAIAAGVERRLADDFVKVNANIDDQPTTFNITPS